MAVDLTAFCNWIFKNNEYALNRFLNENMKNRIKASEKTKIRNIDVLNDIDLKYIEKSYNRKSENSIGELKSEIKTAYVTKQFSLKMIDWYIIKPLSREGVDIYRTYYAVYFPFSDSIEELKKYLVDKRSPCFECDWLSVTDMTDGKESIIFVGGLDQPEPECTDVTKEHDWEWLVYHEDCKEILFAECKHCHLKRSMVVGDTRAYRWNDNHGWRYKK